MCASCKVCRLKNSYDDLISAVDDFAKWYPSTVTPMEELCILQRGLLIVFHLGHPMNFSADPCIINSI